MRCRIVAVIVLTIGGDASMPARSQDRTPQTAFTAIDANTIKSLAGVRYRLLGYDAPQTALAQCVAELNAGTAAKRRLQSVLDTGAVRLVESGQRDQYGRALATLYVDVAAILIGEKLAGIPALGGARHDWCKASAQ